ncbi:MAG: LapA family protein [Brevinematales bacterium]|nr:LapA family protein [Brevinematales bacterium]
MSHFWVKVGILVGILLLLSVLILQNVASVVVNLFFWSFQLPLIVVMILFFLGGFVVGIIVAALAHTKSAEPR